MMRSLPIALVVSPRDQLDVSYNLTAAGDNWTATSITFEDVARARIWAGSSNIFWAARALTTCLR
jgi:hypothetical protein